MIEQHRGQAGGTMEMRWKRKNGDVMLVRLTARTIVSHGQESYETIAEDVTEKRALEEQLRQAQEPQAVDIHAAAQGFESTLQRIIGSDVATTVRTSGEPPVVRVEPGQLEQILMNLAVNARDAMPDGGTLDIAIDTVDVDERNAANYPGMPAYRYARVAVKDSGMGMDPELQRQVFEPFFTTKDPSKGTGLGLSIVYSIAKESGGTVTCASTVGKGTTFEVLLPLIPSP